MATQIWVNTGSGNDLLSEVTKPLPEPVLTQDQYDPTAFLKSYPNLPGLNE